MQFLINAAVNIDTCKKKMRTIFYWLRESGLCNSSLGASVDWLCGSSKSPHVSEPQFLFAWNGSRNVSYLWGSLGCWGLQQLLQSTQGGGRGVQGALCQYWRRFDSSRSQP